jgi:hypothetical protein
LLIGSFGKNSLPPPNVSFLPTDVSFFVLIGLGPITRVYSSDIFPMRLRAQGSSTAISVNQLVSGVVSMTFLSI